MIRLYRNYFKVEESIPDIAIVSRIAFAFLMLCAIAYAAYREVPQVIPLFRNKEKQAAPNKALILISTIDNRATPGDKPGGGT